MFDLGIEYAKSHSDQNFENSHKALFGRIVLYRPQGEVDLGLEAKGLYANRSYTLSYSDPLYSKETNNAFQTDLRGFYHHSTGPKSGVMVGLSVLYRFYKNQVLDTNDAVSIGHDFGEFGFVLDFNYLFWGFAHWSIGLEYAQERWQSEDWAGVVFSSFGLLIGRKSGQDEVNHE
jgi:hypothetical protein